MNIPDKYFRIGIEMLKGDLKIFPFHLFLLNPINQSLTPFLAANSPLDDHKMALLEVIVGKGGEIAVDLSQKKTFFYSTHVSEEKIPDLKNHSTHPLEKSRELYIQLHQKRKEDQKKENNIFVFKDEFTKAIHSKNYRYIIEEVRSEVLTFSVTNSPTVSLSIYLCETLMPQDNLCNRITALCYLLAKQIKIQDESSLSDLICASYLHHIGLSQLPRQIVLNPYTELNVKDQSLYRKHVGLAQHLIRKTKIQLSNQCLKIILEHHERKDGDGYPLMKKGEHIHPLSAILGLVSHLFEYAYGFYNGQPESLRSCILKLKNKNKTTGLEFGFNDNIIEGLLSSMKFD